MVIGGKFTQREGPGWLPSLLNIENFFAHCNNHTTGKNEKNQYCFDCQSGPLCPEGLAQSHVGHATIQIRRASHRDVVRIADIQKFVDLANIQLYTINSAKILFLQSRPQPKMVKGASHYCETCHRSIADPVRFCSILCKLTAIRENPHDFTLSLTVSNKVGQGFNSRGNSSNSQDGSFLSHSTEMADFMPSTPKKGVKRASKEDTETVFEKRKVALTEGIAADRNHPVFGMSVLIPSEVEMAISMLSPSLLGPSTPTLEAGIRVHHRKQIRPHRAPMF